MKKHRKQSVNVFGYKRLVDVPVDDELYKIDNHEEYQRRRSKAKHISLDDFIAEFTADVMGNYEESQLLECLLEALQTLTEEEYQLIQYIFYDGFTEQETAVILKVTQKTVNIRKHEVINKLRDNLKDWL